MTNNLSNLIKGLLATVILFAIGYVALQLVGVVLGIVFKIVGVLLCIGVGYYVVWRLGRTP